MAKKRGRKPLGGIRVLLRLTSEETETLDRVRKDLGMTRTALIRRAIEQTYMQKRRANDRKS